MTGQHFTTHLLALSDDTGLAQHARYRFVDRSHGYCLDDNARAATVLCRLAKVRSLSRREEAALASYCAFIDHAFDRASLRFRNFMGYDCRWLEKEGAEDASARAMLALSVMIAMPPLPWMRNWARDLLDQMLPGLHQFSSPRSWSFVLTGLNMLLRIDPSWQEAEKIRENLALRLLQRWRDAAMPHWPWFEDELAYDNGRLPQAAIATGTTLGMTELRSAGLSALDALWNWQFDGAVFHPVGSDSFGRKHEAPSRFDQQPIDVSAMIDACMTAAAAGAKPDLWRTRADVAMAWFFGRNDLQTPVVESVRGLCHDGLHADRMNANAGAESTLAYLGAALSMIAPETL